MNLTELQTEYSRLVASMSWFDELDPKDAEACAYYQQKIEEIKLLIDANKQFTPD